MKKILLVNKSFEIGGIQSSMINMVNELSQYYEIHLFIYNPVGAMKERLSANVKLLDTSWRFRCLGMSVKDVLRTKNAKMIAFRLFATAWSKMFSNKLPIKIAIKHQPQMIGYDLAIAYHQEQRKKSATSGFVRVVDKCVQAETKAAWLHFDPTVLDLDSQYNNAFYDTMDRVVCVSKSLMDAFAKKHPRFSDKMDYCYNFMLYNAIKEKSLLQQEIPYPADKFVCFSACRLAPEKALPRGIKALAPTLKNHPEIVWYIAGDGVEKANIEAAIKEAGMESQVFLIGNQPNPYPYMKNADLVLNLSYHEAAPMVFFESSAIGTPIFATRTLSAEELLLNESDDFICANSESGIQEAFAQLIKNKENVEKAKIKLQNYQASNIPSAKKIHELINKTNDKVYDEHSN